MEQQHDCLIVILGMGDFAKKKLIPAIYNLLKNKELSNFAVVGASRKKASAAEMVKNSEHIKDKDPGLLKELKKRFYYQDMDFYNHEDNNRLAKLLSAVEKKHRLGGNRIFYLATIPDHFNEIANKLNAYRMTETKGWSRVVFEKPFGHDLDDFKKSDKSIKKVFSEKQIYRFDQYIGKDLLENMSVLRFTNMFMGPLWNKQHIDHIQIIITDGKHVTDGEVYDSYGALKDMIQHAMQMLSITTMEQPKSMDEKYVRDERLRIINKVRIKRLLTGQYKDYVKEVGVKAYSKTETLVAAKLMINTPRWRGMPIYLLSGKRMKTKSVGIYIQFKHATTKLFRDGRDGNAIHANHITIQIQPKDGTFIGMNMFDPGNSEVIQAKIDLCKALDCRPNTAESYENLLLDVVNGDQSAFIRSDEIESSLRLVPKTISCDPEIYEHGHIPEKIKKMIEKDGRVWNIMIGER